MVATLKRTEMNSAVSRRALELLRAASIDCGTKNPLGMLASKLGPDELDLVILFLSPKSDIADIVPRAKGFFADATVIGCSTAGEISEIGYTSEKIVALGLPKSHFRSRTTLIEDLVDYEPKALSRRLAEARGELANEVPEWANEFNFMLIDGMSGREDGFALTLSSGWGPAPLFGGAAGDGTRFMTTFIVHNDRVYDKNAAVLSNIRTQCPVRVFKTDHVVPTGQRMVVTGADTRRRLVHEINAEPAAKEYARLVGVPLDGLNEVVLGTNPVVVRIAGQHYVRGIRNVTDDGSLLFTAAIDEGLVLTLAKTTDIVSHLEQELLNLTRNDQLVGVVACDCLYRRTDAEENNVLSDMSKILTEFRVFGFSSYGELFHSMHVNQTLTGVAIYAPPQG